MMITSHVRLVALPILFSIVFSIFLNERINAQNDGNPKTEPVSIKVDFNKSKGAMKPIWAFFGYDEPNYTYMKDGKKLLSEISKLSKVPVNVRVHSLLVSGDGIAALKWGSTNAYTEDTQGKPIYNWNIIDSIFDTFIARGMKPIAQVGFMPEALSTKPQPYRHHWAPGEKYNDIYTGWAYPPKDYTKFARPGLRMGKALSSKVWKG
jgi:xylan 1,4-beta-xylosidase